MTGEELASDEGGAGVVQIEEPDKLVSIEMEYTQQMTVTIPVYDIPPTPEDAWQLVKDTDPEFVADAIPNRWEDVFSVGELKVTDIDEVDDER